MISPDANGAEVSLVIGPVYAPEASTLTQRKMGQKLETGISGFLTTQTQNKKAREGFEYARQKVTGDGLAEEQDYRGIVESLGYKFKCPNADSMYTAAYHLLSQAGNFNAIWEKQLPKNEEKNRAISGASEDLAGYLIALGLDEKDLKVLLNTIK